MDNTVTIGHNGAPSPIEEVQAEYADIIDECQNWADGENVTNEAQMGEVDGLLKSFKSYRTALTKAGKEITAPAHAEWKEKVAAVKVQTDDADKLQKCLVAIVAPFKKELADKKAKEEREAWEKKQEAERVARELEVKASAGSIDDQREVEAAKQAVIDADKAARSVKKEAPKGLRKVKRHEIQDGKKLINWIAINDKDAITEFITEYARKNHEAIPQEVVRSWEEKEAF